VYTNLTLSFVSIDIMLIFINKQNINLLLFLSKILVFQIKILKLKTLKIKLKLMVEINK
jgi:hypothetical protein